MPTLATLLVFIPTFTLVSLTPGMCMMLALVLGMTQGVGRSLWMMAGELIGVGLVALAAAVGVAALMLDFPEFFTVFKWLGGAYLGWLGVSMWRSRGSLAIPDDLTQVARVRPWSLAMQGFVTAVANPKGWAFFMVLLPPFLDQKRPLGLQLGVLLSVILIIEFMSLLVYAGGGRQLGHLLSHADNVRLLNRLAGTLMVGVGIWLAIG